jgi:predicted ArsR family transcriptional regulator
MSESVSTPTQHQEEALEAIAALAEPMRRSVYEVVSTSREAMSRDSVANRLGVSRQVAAYHLDVLADSGLLDVEFKRLTGRDGPGAGRPAKLYRRAGETVEFSVPPRRYELAARILLETVRAAHLDEAALETAAHSAGCRIGAHGLELALREMGYEPAEESNETRFMNCPFHVLREQDQETTCRMNLALVEGLIEGSGSEMTASLAPEDGYCCVRLSAKSR